VTYTGVARRQWASLVRTPLLGQLSRVDLRVLTSGVGFLRYGRSFLGAGRRSDAPHYGVPGRALLGRRASWVGSTLRGARAANNLQGVPLSAPLWVPCLHTTLPARYP
jgi:hypothetical protein